MSYGQEMLIQSLGYYVANDNHAGHVDDITEAAAKEPRKALEELIKQLSDLALSHGANSEEIKGLTRDIKDGICTLIYPCVGQEAYKHGFVDGLHLMGLQLSVYEIDRAEKRAREEFQSEKDSWFNFGRKCGVTIVRQCG